MPSNRFGGYKVAFPKGTVEQGWALSAMGWETQSVAFVPRRGLRKVAVHTNDAPILWVQGESMCTQDRRYGVPGVEAQCFD